MRKLNLEKIAQKFWRHLTLLSMVLWIMTSSVLIHLPLTQKCLNHNSDMKTSVLYHGIYAMRLQYNQLIFGHFPDLPSLYELLALVSLLSIPN